MAVDVETKYLFNSFLDVGKDENRSGDVSVPTDSDETYNAFVQEWTQRNQ